MTGIPICFAPGGEAMEKDFAGHGVEVDSSSALSSQVGCPHDEALLRQYLFRYLAVLGTHGGPVPSASGGKDVGAAE
jgi:hypothetical protein